MNLFFADDFDADTAGALPAWFSVISGTWGVVADGSAYSAPNDFQNPSQTDGGKVLLLGGSGVSIPATADMELTYVTKSLVNPNGIQPILRSDSGAQNYYVWLLEPLGGTVRFQLCKCVSGSLSTIGGVIDSGYAYLAGVAISIKVAAIGTTISAKVWTAGTTEPGSYQVNETDSSVTAAGYAGFYQAGTGTGYAVDNVQLFGNSSLAAGTLSASSITGNSATITSTGASGGTGPYTYQLYRANSVNFVPQTSNLVSGATGLTANYTGLASSTTYYNIQTATDSTGAIVWSNEFSFTTSAGSATDFTFTPSSQSTNVGVPTGNYTITPNGVPSSSTAIALSDGANGGTFIPLSLTFTTATPQTFTYTPSASDPTETLTLTATASGGFSATHTASCAVTNTAATNFTLSPSSQTTVPNVVTGNYTVAINGTLATNETITLSDASGGGAFTPSSLTFTSANAGTPQTFTYTPASGAGATTKTLTATGTGAFSASHNASCVVNTASGAGIAYATYVGAQTVQLSSTEATGGSGSFTFQWYRSTTSGSLGSAISGATAESYIDTGRTPGTGYFYTQAYTDTVSSTTVYSTQIAITTMAATNLEIVAGIGDSIEAGSYSTIESPFAAMIDQLNFGMPSKEWYGGTNTTATGGGLSFSLDFAVSGTATSDWLPAGSYLANAATVGAAAGVTRIVSNLGANDAQTGVATPPSTYQSNYQTIISYLFANIPTLKSIHLVGPMFQGKSSGSYSVQNSGRLIAYDAAMTALANGTTIFHKNPLGPYNYFQRRPFLQRSQDYLHPIDVGDQATAGNWSIQIILALISTTITSTTPSHQLKRARS